MVEAHEPQPQPGNLIVAVDHTSLNRGEVLRARAAPPGFRPGWDFAGTVIDAGRRTDLPEGTRVAGYLTSGAWAERISVPASLVAPVPDGVSMAEAAALPVAALTALGALDAGGNLLARKVLVTGATGGVGAFAVHLAMLAGAEVTALVRGEVETRRDLFPSGTRIVSSQNGLAQLEALAPFDLVVETLGGETLGQAMTLLSASGKCVTLGVTGGAQVSFDAERFFMTGTASLEGYVLFRDRKVTPAQGMARLLALVAQGRLPVPIGIIDTWENIEDVAERLLARAFTGKAVLAIAGAAQGA
jgi:NADPH:quinone reductase-like Zn-dependent oxidoreductase